MHILFRFDRNQARKNEKIGNIEHFKCMSWIQMLKQIYYVLLKDCSIEGESSFFLPILSH